MKALFWIGAALLVLGIVLLAVPLPHSERQGIRAGGVSIGIETQHDEKVSPYVCALLALGGAGMMIVSKLRS